MSASVVADFTSAKTLVPRALRGELERSHLLERFQAETGFQLVVLYAPAGYGKTTLLAQFARRSERPTAWLEITPDEAAPGALAVSLRDAVRRVLSNAPFEALEAVLGRQTAEQTTEQVEVLARAFARDLNALEINLNLVLDETEELNSESGRWIAALVAQLEEGHRVFLSGFDLRHVPIARLVARGDVLLIDQQDLRFSLEETGAYLQTRAFTGTVDQAYASSEGWAAGLALIASGVAPHVTPATLIEEALGRLPTDLRRALPEAAPLTVWHEDSARGLGCQLPEGWLDGVRQSGLPLTALGNEAYRPHPLLREVLERHLRRDSRRHTKLHDRAGDLALGEGNAISALEHHLRSGNLEAQRGAAHVAVARFQIASEHHLVRLWLERLPAAALDDALSIALGSARIMTGDPERGGARLRVMRAAGTANATALTALARIAHRQGNAAELLELIEEALHLGGSDAEMALCRRLRGYALIGLGRAPEALEIAQAEVSRATHPNTLSASLKLEHRARFALSQRSACIPILKRCITLGETLDAPKDTLSIRNDLADLYRLEGRVNEALEELERAFAILGNEQTEELPFMQETRGDLHFWRGDLITAKLDFEHALALSTRFQLAVLEFRVTLKLAEIAALQSRFRDAEDALERLRVLPLMARPTLQAAWQFCAGITAFLGGHFDVSETALLAVREISSDDPSHAPRAAALLCQIAWQRGDLTIEATHSWERALLELGSDAVIALDASRVQPALTAALQSQWLPQTRFAAFVETQHAAPVEVWQPQALSLSLETFGKRRVSVNGSALDVPLAKSFELLVRLALEGSTSRDKLIDALWDGSNEHRHVEYFKVAVRRLRANLEAHPEVDFNPLPFDDCYALSERFDLHWDARRLERAVETQDPNELEGCIAAYRGEFLPGIETEWVQQQRAKLSITVLEACESLGRLSRAARPELALWAFKRGLELEPLHEHCALGLILTHAQLGDARNAERAYWSFERQLQTETGLQPSREWGRRLEAAGFDPGSPPIPR